MKKIILLITLTLFSLCSIVNADNTDTRINQKMKLIFIGKNKSGYDQYLKVTPVIAQIHHLVFADRKIEKYNQDTGFYDSFTSIKILFDDGDELDYGYLGSRFDSVVNKKISKIVLDGVEINTGLLIEKGTIQKAYDSIPVEKTYLELNTEYNSEKGKTTNVDGKKLDSISADILNKVKGYDNYRDYLKNEKSFKKVLAKAQKTDKTFGEFYNEWITLKDKIDNSLSSGKITDEYKLKKLYTIQTNINEMIDGLCNKIGGCGIGQDDAKKLKDIK